MTQPNHSAATITVDPPTHQKNPHMNAHVLMTDARHIGLAGINAHEDSSQLPDAKIAEQELEVIRQAFTEAGIKITSRPSPAGLQDGVYTANWGFTWRKKAILSNLPNARKGEEAAAEAVLSELGFECRRPQGIYSGQGDTLLLNDSQVLLGYGYRTPAVTPKLERLFRDWLGLEPIPIHTIPKRKFDWLWPVRNAVTGLWDSYFYDLDLAICVLAQNVIGVCWDALSAPSRQTVRNLQYHRVNPVKIIPIALHDARYAFSANTVSTGNVVITPAGAPDFILDLQRHGFEVIPVEIDEFRKTGGGCRCVSLTLND